MAKNQEYFKGVGTIEELKSMYHNYIKMYHPDKHPKNKEEYTEIMGKINAEYDKVFENVKNQHLGWDKKECKYYTYTKETEESVEEFKNVINELQKFRKINVELIGAWLWVSGDTKRIKDKLKELGLHYAPQKNAWEFHTGVYKRKSKPQGNMDELRTKYGSINMKGEEQEQLVLA